jgi:hypothetical protein
MSVCTCKNDVECQFLALISSLPEEKQKVLFYKAQVALTLGLRSIILNSLESADRYEFERIILEEDDDDLFLFGQTHIENFESKFASITDEVRKALKSSL